MCGIVGCVGHKKAKSFLLEGLKTLEYRGYDSCGIALQTEGGLRLARVKGEVDGLAAKTKDWAEEGETGIGHTRWATHGRPLVKNAHPHRDCLGKVMVAHNGIVENYQVLKKELSARGHRFFSETDTEVIAHLIEESLREKKDLFWATREALKKVIGAYGVVVIGEEFPGELVAARMSSPLILGFGKGENFVASDQLALLPRTKELGVLKDGQVAHLTAEKVRVMTLDGQAGLYQRLLVENQEEVVSRGKYPHFMLKEIFEQPKVVEDGLRGRFFLGEGVALGGIKDWLVRMAREKSLTLVACGTSRHAAMIAKEYWQRLAGIPVQVENATELVGSGFPWRKGQPVVFVSQSGETAEVLAVCREAKKKGVIALGVTNVAGSSLARETKAGVYTRAGFEIGVAATKTFTAQVLVFLLWGMALAQKRERRMEMGLRRQLAGLPGRIKAVLKKEKEIEAVAQELAKKEKIYLLGRGMGFALASEGALKIKEIAYLPAEAIGLGELKHGPLALVDRRTRLIFLLPDDRQYAKNLNSINEALARGGKAVVITNREDFQGRAGVTVCRLPKGNEFLAVFEMAVWLQLLAYKLAIKLKWPIDKPRNLAKSVTVE